MAGITLPDGWTDEMTPALQARDLATDASFAVAVQITGVTNGDVTASWRAEAGRLAAVDNVDDPEVLVTIAAKDALEVLTGNTPLAVGFMRGKVKITGDPTLAMHVLKAASPAPA